MVHGRIAINPEKMPSLDLQVEEKGNAKTDHQVKEDVVETKIIVFEEGSQEFHVPHQAHVALGVKDGLLTHIRLNSGEWQRRQESRGWPPARETLEG